MGDLRAPLRMLDQLLWMLRRRGLVVSTAQALAAFEAARLVGFGERETLRGALAATILVHARDRTRFDETFDDFFARRPTPRTLADRLAVLGIEAAKISEIESLLQAHLKGDGFDLAILDGEAGLEHRLSQADARRALEGMAGERTLGFYTHRAMRTLGFPAARRGMRQLGRALTELLGDDGTSTRALAALEQALQQAEEAARDRIRQRAKEAEISVQSGALGTAFAAMSDEERAAARRAVALLAARLQAAQRARSRRKKRVHLARTMRAALATGGVPFRLLRRAKRPRTTSLVLLCDISDSVRAASRFLLEFCLAARELFVGARLFVFVGNVAEVTDLFAKNDPSVALAQLASGGVVPIVANSNYGKVFERFAATVAPTLDRRSTVVILGDGRTNYLPDGAAALGRIAARVKRIWWLCPEPRARWGTSDSAMARYEGLVSRVFPAVTPADLELAARSFVSERV